MLQSAVGLADSSGPISRRHSLASDRVAMWPYRRELARLRDEPVQSRVQKSIFQGVVARSSQEQDFQVANCPIVSSTSPFARDDGDIPTTTCTCTEMIAHIRNEFPS